jgi:choline dehydrogenase
MALPAVWDYIVVGGGLAGTVVTSRLHQYNATAQILMIEVGTDVSNREDILYHNSTTTGELDWGYSSTPQRHLNDKVMPQPAARAIGGGSAMNGCECITLIY